MAKQLQTITLNNSLHISVTRDGDQTSPSVSVAWTVENSDLVLLYLLYSSNRRVYVAGLCE